MTAPGVRSMASTVAAEAIDEIVVTAQRREESAQDLPLSVTAFNAQSLEERLIGLDRARAFAGGLLRHVGLLG